MTATQARPALAKNLCIAFAGMNGGDVVVERDANHSHGIYQATELAVLHLAYYGHTPAYKLLDGVVTACRPAEIEGPEVSYSDLRVSRAMSVRGSVAATVNRGAKAMAHGPEKWDYIECADAVKALIANRSARGLGRF